MLIFIFIKQLPEESPLLPGLNADKISDSFRRVVKKLGIKNLCFHDLRRTCIKELSVIEPNLYVLKEITGHSGIDVLSHYIPVGYEDKMRVMERFEKKNFTIHKTNGSEK